MQTINQYVKLIEVNMKGKILCIMSFCLWLSACVNTPHHVIVTPEMHIKATGLYLDKQANLTASDRRASKAIIQIVTEGKPAILLSSYERLDKIIKKYLAQSWQNQGLQLNSNAANNIVISVEKAIVTVSQKTMGYKAESEIIIQVQLNNGQQTLTNRFKNTGRSEGLFNVDIAVLERDFNQNLTTLLQQIIMSKDINAFI